MFMVHPPEIATRQPTQGRTRAIREADRKPKLLNIHRP